MVYRGRIRNGKIELDEDVTLPDGTAVEVVVRENQPDQDGGPTLYDRLKDFVGSVDDLPPDASVNVDHYLYGHPKR